MVSGTAVPDGAEATRPPRTRYLPAMASPLRWLALLTGTLAVAPACGEEARPDPVEIAGDGARVRVDLDPFVVVVSDAAGREVLRTLPGGEGDAYGSPAVTRDDGADAVKALPGWDGYAPEEQSWAHGRVGTLVAREGDRARFTVAAGDLAIGVEIVVAPGKVHITTRVDGGDRNKTSLSFALRDDEHFFGLGERFASVDHRGLSMYSWSEEGGTGRGEGAPRDDSSPGPNGPSMTYFPVPFFLSSAGYAVHLATTHRTETHLGSERKDAWRVAANAPRLETVVYVNEDPLAALDAFTKDTGRPMVPPTWVFGPRRRVSLGDATNGVDEWKLLRDRKVPTTGLDDNVHFLPARSELGRETELRAWVDRLHANGFKVMAYNNPYVSTSKATVTEEVAYGKANGLFATTPEGAIGETFFISGEPQTLATIDLTKPEAVLWFQSLLRRTLAFGYDGWMHDFGEYVRRSWRFADGRDGAAVHNEFPVLSAKAAHDLLAQEKPGDFLFFVRSGYTGSQQWVPAVWSGDPEATFDDTQGIPAMLRGGLNLGMSGVPLWGSDVTGFKCLTEDPKDKEVHLRWAELGAVSPIMQEQNACANPLQRRSKWKLWDDDETVAVYGAMARLHTRLAPYFDVLAREAHARGVPIMRHPFLHHPKEPEAWRTESAFYLGPSLWAAPVVARGQRTKETWLPPGRWVDIVDRIVFDGGERGAKVSIPAPLAKLPLLLKDGGIVPLLDASIDTLAPASEPTVVTPEKVADRLDVLVALGPGREARFALADGTELVARRLAAGAALAPTTLPVVDPAAASDAVACPDGCTVTVTEASASRVYVTTPLASASTIAQGDLVLEVRGARARRVRWDVTALAN